MQVEEGALGTLRFDALFGSGATDAWILLHTQLASKSEILKLVESLQDSYASLWSFPPTTHWQIHGDCISECCTVLVANELNRQEDEVFGTQLLTEYRATLRQCGPYGIQPPVAHRVHFMRNGKCVHYEGKD